MGTQAADNVAYRVVKSVVRACYNVSRKCCRSAAKDRTQFPENSSLRISAKNWCTNAKQTSFFSIFRAARVCIVCSCRDTCSIKTCGIHDISSHRDSGIYSDKKTESVVPFHRAEYEDSTRTSFAKIPRCDFCVTSPFTQILNMISRPGSISRSQRHDARNSILADGWRISSQELTALFGRLLRRVIVRLWFNVESIFAASSGVKNRKSGIQ